MLYDNDMFDNIADNGVGKIVIFKICNYLIRGLNINKKLKKKHIIIN